MADLPKYLMLAHWLYEKKSMVLISDISEYMRLMPSAIRPYIKAMQRCENVLSLKLYYKNNSIVGIEVLNIAPYDYVPGRAPRIRVGDIDLVTYVHPKLSKNEYWQVLLRSDWTKLSFER